MTTRDPRQAWRDGGPIAFAAFAVAIMALVVSVLSPVTAGTSGGGGGAAAASPITLVESQTVTGSAVTTITFSGLDGDADRLYLLFYDIRDADTGTPANYHLSASGLGVTIDGAQSVEGTLSNANSTDASGVNVSSFSSAGSAAGHAFIHAAIGWDRRIASQSNAWVRGNANNRSFFYSGIFDDTSTNITNITITSSAADQIDVGSVATLYKLSGHGGS